MNHQNNNLGDVQCDSIRIGGVSGSKGLKINREGLWFGGTTKNDAVLAIGMDGSNNIVASGKFTDLNDTFGSYTNSYAILTVNSSVNGLAESTIRCQVVIGGFKLFNASQSISIKSTITIDQDISTTSSPSFDKIYSFFMPVTSSDTLAPNGSIYFSSDTSKLTFKDNGGVTHDLY